ncbi:MAG: hypothetical protein R3Y68_02135 [Rikenellaceae bacterium]
MTGIDFTPTGDVAFDHLMHEVQTGIQITNDLILPDEMVISAVHSACDFFNLPEIPVLDSDQVCVWNGDGDDLYDDVLGFNRQQLMEMGIKGEDSLTLVYTHECAHRALQGFSNLDPWEHELACDYFAGIHAGLKGINTDNFEDSLSGTRGGSTHPAGDLRADFIEYGDQMAQEMLDRGIEINFENCLARFNAHLIVQDDLIAQEKLEAGLPITSSPNYADTVDSLSDPERHAENVVSSSPVSFGAKYTESQIGAMERQVDSCERDVIRYRNEVSSKDRIVSTSNTTLGRENGSYEQALKELHQAENKLYDAENDLKHAKSKLRGAK